MSSWINASAFDFAASSVMVIPLGDGCVDLHRNPKGVATLDGAA